MIECNPLPSVHRADGKAVYTRFSKAFIDMATDRIYLEIPEGRDTSEFATYNSGRLRCDQTGALYETAHDVEDAPFTYTEAFPDPDSVCEYNYTAVTGASMYACHVNTNVYPEYKSTGIYAEGDIVTYDNHTYISDFDDNTGNRPDKQWGWSCYLPYIDKREVHYRSVAELYPEGE